MRILWVLAMLALCILFGWVSFRHFATVFLILTGDDPVLAIRLPAAIFWGCFFFVLSGGCAAMTRMKPSEAKAVMKEPEAPRAAWLYDLNKPPS